MPELEQPNTLGDGVLWEEENDYSREKIIVASGQNLAILTVYGIITASAKAVILAPAATDGSEVAAGVTVVATDASAADKEGAGLVRHALVNPDVLVWPDGILDGEKDQALSELADRGVHSRQTA